MTYKIEPNTDPNVVRIFLVRHGTTDHNANRIMQGHLDIDLNDEGRQQAEKVAIYLKDIELDYIVSSDLIRCVNTAQAIAQKQKNAINDISTTPDLRERDVGPLEGMREADAVSKYGHSFKHIGEKEEDLINRVAEVWEQTFKKAVSENYTNAVLCTHGGVIKVFVKHLHYVQGYNLARGVTLQYLRVPNASVTTVDLDKTTGEGLIQDFGNSGFLSVPLFLLRRRLR